MEKDIRMAENIATDDEKPPSDPVEKEKALVPEREEVSQQIAKSSNVKKKVSSTSKRKGSEWEILRSLEKGQDYLIKPKKHEGYLSKKRKWPLKGWHKR